MSHFVINMAKKERWVHSGWLFTVEVDFTFTLASLEKTRSDPVSLKGKFNPQKQR